MQDNSLYNIKHLKCSYDGSGDLIHVKDVNIERGKIYFILGKSGAGKSTIIEALGLMNKTVHEESECQLNIEGKFHEIHTLWRYPVEVMSKIRANYFSFLFQTPNLIDYYSAGENMVFPLLMSGLDIEESKHIIAGLIEEFELPATIFDQRVSHLSGGQKQRVAFIRALVGEYKLLIADEPTGNLDRETGDKLFDTLRQHIKECNKTAIVVSHNTELAYKYADFIYTIKQQDGGPNTGHLLKLEQVKGKHQVIGTNQSAIKIGA